MYFNILKKDLKRKKTMNVILLLFTILASVFVSSGLSNVVSVMNGTDYFIDQAGVGDYIIITQNGEGQAGKLVDESKLVSGYRKDNCYWGSIEQVKVEGREIVSKSNNILIQPIGKNGITLFDTDNQVLKEISKGEIRVTAGFLKENNAAVGDKIDISYHGLEKSYTIKGEIKDALLGSDMMGNTRFVISDEDYKDYEDDKSLDPYKGCLFMVDTDDTAAFRKETSGLENVLFGDSKAIIEKSYIMDMIVAMVVLVLSICLCIVSFVLLKFVITFSINEDFREIGVMKAIGIKNFKIRSLYIVKYFAIALVGSVIGFFISIPFGELLMKSVTAKMVLGNDIGPVMNLIGTILVIVVMVGFAFFCTSKIKKFTPVDAIRSGQSGERFGKKSILSLKKSHLKNALFLAVNDILSAPKRFLTIVLSLFICSVFVFGLVLTTDTMLSDKLITTFGSRSDIYINDSKLVS
ncbi:MAG: ABC transporter permease, partial [Lachnospiraceae bacterium]|nr:ABC transporter permease [Lachnospiraceae bacterium]